MPKNNVSKYIKDLFDILSSEYSVGYYIEECGDEYTDCFILNNFCIKLDRVDADEVSEENIVR